MHVVTEKEELVKQIEGTPIATVKTEQGYIAVIGRYNVYGKTFETIEEVENIVKSTDWQGILCFISAYMERMIEDKFLTLNTKENDNNK